MEQVSWNDAKEFIGKLNARSGGGKLRLPTEAEWEYACRSGGKAEKYAGGGDVDRVAWYAGNSGRLHPSGGHEVAQRSGALRHERQCSGVVRGRICGRCVQHAPA